MESERVDTNTQPDQALSGENGASPDRFEEELVDRRHRLERSLIHSPENPNLRSLLVQVDDALARLRTGGFGQCQACHDRIEGDRLAADPLLRVCLACLSKAQGRQLEDDLHLASRIQRALLPPSDLGVYGWDIRYRYEPAGPVSGDFYDIIADDDIAGAFHFFFGDISGKGVSASILMSSLQAILRSLTGEGVPLLELVGRANRLFSQTTLAMHFATLVAGRATLDGRIQLVNAGHCPPYLLRNDDVVALPADGLPVGIFPTAEYELRMVELSPGEQLFLHTDGFSEAMNQSEDQYGEERLSSLLSDVVRESPADVIDMSLQDLARFRNGAASSDDLTLMTLGRAAA